MKGKYVTHRRLTLHKNYLKEADEEVSRDYPPCKENSSEIAMTNVKSHQNISCDR